MGTANAIGFNPYNIPETVRELVEYTNRGVKENVVSVDANYTIRDYDTVILCDCTNGPVTLSTSAKGAKGRVLRFKKVAGTYDIVFDPYEFELIDNADDAFISTLYGAATVIFDGDNWWSL